MPTVAERYKFAEVEHDGKQFMNELFKQSKVFAVGSMTEETMMKLGNKDVVAKFLVTALQLLERQHNMVINQRVHLSSYQQDIIRLQRRKHYKQHADRISSLVKDSVQSSIKLYSEAAGSSSVPEF